jgi:NTP pyrophosphatase (non-canonical NTP hydrolase)
MLDREVSQALRNLVEERDWAQFHDPASLAKSIVIEAAELLECFQWADAAPVDRVAEELADVITYCQLLADRLNLDVDKIVSDTLEQTKVKYPVDRARGQSLKYDQLPD